MSVINPPPIKIPDGLTKDQNVYQFFRSLLEVIRLLWVNAGGANGGIVPVTSGGTGADDAAEARTNLGLEIGADVQAWNSNLDTLAGLTPGNNFIMGDGSDWSTITLTQLRSIALSSLNDAQFQIEDNSDSSKLLKLELSGITTATTRTLAIPDASGTIVLNDNTATLSGKSIDLTDNTLTGTMAEFDTAVSDGNIAYAGGAYHDGFSDFVANEHIDWTAASSNFSTSGGITAASANGVDYSPGSDIDTDIITVNVTDTPRMFWDESQDRFSLNKGIEITAGRLLVGTATPDTAAPALDLLKSTGVQFLMTDTTTDATNKAARFGGRHYTNTEEPQGFFLFSTATNNVFNYGGGTSLLNATTIHDWYAAANNTTVTGTAIMRLTTAGLRVGSNTTALNTLDVTGTFGRGAPVTKTADFTLAATENWVINNKSGSACVVTLPAASSWTGREVMVVNYQAQQLNSASSNVVPLGGGAAGTAILTAATGRWATLVSNGTNWVIMQGVI